MKLLVSGRVTDQDTGAGVANLEVEVMDRDLMFDDRLGNTTTASDGAYCVEVDSEAGRDLIESKPDVYIQVRPLGAKRDRILGSTRSRALRNVEGDVQVDLEIPHDTLVEAGLADD
jgi:hypothetical protein